MAKKKGVEKIEVTLAEKAKTLIEITRPVNCGMIGISVAIAMWVGFGGMPLFVLLIAALVAAIGINAAGNALNDYYDIDIDRINKPGKALPSGKITKVGLWIYATLLFAMGNTVAMLYLTKIPIIIAVINSVLLIVYAIKVKKSGFLGNIMISYLVASVFAFAAAVVDALMIGIFLSIAAFFTNAAREILKDLEDVRGDELGGAQTLPLAEGGKKTMIVVASFLILAIILSPLPYLLEILSMYYIAIILVADTILLGVIYSVLNKRTRKSATVNQRRIKFAAIIGILAFLAGTVPWP
ncbi:MAG: UbiA family prenyltransferase [archaeon]